MTELVALRRALHARPELGFCEIETAARVLAELAGSGVEVSYGALVCDVDGLPGLPGPAELATARDRALAAGVPPEQVEGLAGGRTALVATVRGERPGPMVGLRCDLDALPLHESEDADHRPARLGFASELPGVMHACGHDGHVAIGVELLRRLAADRDWAGELRVFFQPAEEGVRGARAMLRAGVAAGVAVMLGLHLGIGLAVGEVAASATGLLATEKWRVRLQGRAAHASLSPESGRSALLGAAAAALGLHGLPQYAGADTRLNVGRLVAGTAPNIVAADAELGCELRADTDEALADLGRRASAMLAGTATAYGLRLSVETTGQAVTVRSDPALVDRLLEAAAGVALIAEVHREAPMAASDDISLFLRAVQGAGGEAALLLVGASSPAPHHDPRFDLDERALPIAVAWLEAVVRYPRGV